MQRFSSALTSSTRPRVSALSLLCSSQPSFMSGKKPKRSKYEYAAAEASETGSRNEATFVDYKPFTPQWFDFKRRMGIISLHNVFTMPVFDCAIIIGSSFVISFFVWEMYCRRRYDFIDIPRPIEPAEAEEGAAEE